jgi:Flp pilus assembly protein TadG
MKRAGGQALVELAVCMPFVLLLALGTTAVVEIADAGSGLHAATEAAVAAAARAPDAATAESAAQSRFASVVAAYPVKSPVLQLEVGGFVRGSTLTANASGTVDLRWESMAVVPAEVAIAAQASMRIEPWRSRQPG